MPLNLTAFAPGFTFFFTSPSYGYCSAKVQLRAVFISGLASNSQVVLVFCLYNIARCVRSVGAISESADVLFGKFSLGCKKNFIPCFEVWRWVSGVYTVLVKPLLSGLSNSTLKKERLHLLKKKSNEKIRRAVRPKLIYFVYNSAVAINPGF